jgi:hypothetical protein
MTRISVQDSAENLTLDQMLRIYVSNNDKSKYYVESANIRLVLRFNTNSVRYNLEFRIKSLNFDGTFRKSWDKKT